MLTLHAENAARNDNNLSVISWNMRFIFQNSKVTDSQFVDFSAYNGIS